MVEKKQRDKPVFKGLHWYRDEHYSFFVPTDWPHSKRSDGKEGVLFQPDASDNKTLLAAEVTPMETSFTSEDKEDLKEGFLEGIKALQDVSIEETKDWEVSNVICLEARFSYTEQNQKLKRWIRVLYRKDQQVSMIAQGSSVEAFDYWLPMFYEAMMTSRVHDQKPSLEA